MKTVLYTSFSATPWLEPSGHCSNGGLRRWRWELDRTSIFSFQTLLRCGPNASDNNTSDTADFPWPQGGFHRVETFFLKQVHV